MKKLHDLIDRLRDVETIECGNASNYTISRRLKKDILFLAEEVLDYISHDEDSCITAFTDKPYLQSGKLAKDLGIPLGFGHWMLTEFDIDAIPDELPTLTTTYTYYKKEK